MSAALRRYAPLVGAGFAIQFLVVGGVVDTVSVFVNALVQAHGWPHTTLSAGIGVGVVCAGLATPGVGWLVDRFGVRIPVALGVAFLAAGFAVLSTMHAAWQFVLANVLLGPGLAGVAMLPITIAVTVRVRERTALALGVVSVGASAGALVLAPSLQALIESHGWRSTYLVLGAAVVAVPLLLLPALPGGRLQGLDTAGRRAAKPPPLDLRQEARRPGVLPLAALLVIPGLVNFGFLVHLVPLLAGMGHDARVAAGALGAAVGISAIGKLAGGLLGDRTGPLRTLRIALLMQVVALALLPLVGDLRMLGLFLALHGLAVGAEVAVTPVLAAQVLGGERFATLYGLLQLGATASIGLAPVIPGVLHDASGSYSTAMLFWLLTMATGVVIAFGMRARSADASAAAPASAALEGERSCSTT